MVVDLASYTSPQMKLIQEMYRAVLEKDTNLFVKSLHTDFRQVFHPQSLGKPSVNKDDWVAVVAGVFGPLVQLECTLISLVEAPGKVVFHISLGMKHGGSSKQDETDESVWIIEFASGEDGSLKIKGLEQFITANHIEFFHAKK